jgi:hypothetical protein
MIRAIKLPAAAALLALGTSAGATTITFGGFAGGTSYSALGVTITAEGQNLLAVDTPNGTTGILPDGSPRPPFTAVFDVLTNSVSIDLGDFGGDSDEIFLQAFGLGGAALGETSLLISASDGSMHTLSINTSGISYVTFGSRGPSLNGSSIYADNLTFDAPVPEPGTWAMMLFGFAGIGWRMRRQRLVGTLSTER